MNPWDYQYEFGEVEEDENLFENLRTHIKERYRRNLCYNKIE
ncbi:hypothetical protein Desaci_3964 [Desulfosporosinus acidiphilus SJ4]|uniref:Uncharacterized protein n=1 Tax=Desulfosporosinus acidiphilus (strain DSM 22704 / JCM 16185 / SJ4) TaxID=646529 RepID=I4DAK9_DESAJ|nr:hypothetical protein Desaci_3964 [Desulfosporosinus acidiphilus SJ4]